MDTPAPQEKGLQPGHEQSIDDAGLVDMYLRYYCWRGTSQEVFNNAYRKLQWYLERHHKRGHIHLQQVTPETARQFLLWLTSPKPEDISKAGQPYRLANGVMNPAWRPLTKGLNRSSVQTTKASLSALWSWGQRALNYFSGNPWTIKVDSLEAFQSRPVIPEVRELPYECMGLLFRFIQRPGADTKKDALRRWLMYLYVHTGSRLQACADATVDQIRFQNGSRKLFLVTKGSKTHVVEWTPKLQSEFIRYRQTMGLEQPQPLPSIRPDEPIIMRLRSSEGREGLSSGQIARHMRSLISEAADWGEAFIDVEGWVVAVLRKASTHWLRHGVVSELVNHYGAARVAQDLAGHTSINTTELYRHGRAAGGDETMIDFIKRLENY